MLPVQFIVIDLVEIPHSTIVMMNTQQPLIFAKSQAKLVIGTQSIPSQS